MFENARTYQTRISTASDNPLSTYASLMAQVEHCLFADIAKGKSSSEIFMLGSKDETGGNQTCTASLAGNDSIHLRIRLPDALAQEHGKYLFLHNIRFAYGHEEIAAAIRSSQFRIGDACKQITDLCTKTQKPLAVENLDFQKKKAQLKEKHNAFPDEEQSILEPSARRLLR